MDTLTGAVIAAAVAWLSIVVAALLPTHWIDTKRLRLVGAGSIVLIAVTVWGAPVPAVVPLAFLAGGVVAAAGPRTVQRPDPSGSA